MSVFVGCHVPNPVEYLSGSIRLDILACSHHDQANDHEPDHDKEALRASKDIENLRKRQLDETTDKTRHDAGGGCQRVARETTGNVWR
jgi:hypothetical protein